MRDFLNAILTFIGAASLSDAEYNSLNFLNLDAGVYNLAAYTELAGVLVAREAVSTITDRLRFFFLSKGVDCPVTSKAASNIFIGAGL